MQALAQIAILTATGGVGAAVSAATKAAYAAFRPSVSSIDAGFIADILKETTKATINTVRKSVGSRYEATRDSRDAFFGAQIDGLSLLAAKQQKRFLHGGKAEILRARDPEKTAQTFLAGLEMTDPSAVKLAQKRASLDQWCIAQARADLGARDPKDPKSPTNMANKPGHLEPLSTPGHLLKGHGVVDILFHADKPADRPQIVRAFVGGLNSKLRALLEERPIGDLPMPLVIRGRVGRPEANNSGAGEVWFTRDESGTISLDLAGAGGSGQGARIDEGTAWLNRRAGSESDTPHGALDGAESVFAAISKLTLTGKLKQ